MKTKKDYRDDRKNKNNDRPEDAINRKKKRKEKTKYKHKSHWLRQSEDYGISILKDEEE